MRILTVLLVILGSMSFAQTKKSALRTTLNDTAFYFIKLSSENPFIIDSVRSLATGRRLEFYTSRQPGKACSSMVCADTGEVVIGFREMQSMKPLSGERRIALNSQTQPTHDFQKGVVVFTRHGKKFRRIAVSSFMEVPPGDPGISPSIIRPNPGK